LGAQWAKFVGELQVEQPSRGLLICEGASDVGADLGDEVGSESEGGVVPLDGAFDTKGVDMWRGAGTGASPAAEEVGVVGAVAVGGVLDRQSLGDPSLVAATAEQGAFEVVVMHPAAFLGGRAGRCDGLDAVEQVWVDEGVVASVELLAVVAVARSSTRVW
jgi:hypothetical protein